jgi:prepilin signal peptidase PulO-like enzyme (type II secretory pathway)
VQLLNVEVIWNLTVFRGFLKFAGMIGAYLGASGLYYAFSIGSVLGVIYAVARDRSLSSTNSIEFGPWLAIGATVSAVLV